MVPTGDKQGTAYGDGVQAQTMRLLASPGARLASPESFRQSYPNSRVGQAATYIQVAKGTFAYIYLHSPSQDESHA